jgi:hypothetical protein
MIFPFRVPSCLRGSIFVLVVLFFAQSRAYAQNTALGFFDTVNGVIDAGAVEDWTLNAPAGSVLSLFVRSATETFDPTLTILEGDDILIANDDYDPATSRDAALEAITLPRTGVYTVRVGGYGTTAGAYTLEVRAGFGQVVLRETFDAEGEWGAVNNSAVNVSAAESALQLGLSGLEQSGVASAANLPTLTDFYASADIASISGRGGWGVALLVRQLGEDAYAFEVDSQGRWRFAVRAGEVVTPVRDWSTHPAIPAGETAFTLGVLVRGSDFDLFYDGALIGSLRDEAAPRPGRVGLALRTGSALDSEILVSVDTITVTAPTEPAIFPQQLIVADGATMAQEMERRGLIAPSTQALNIGESFIDSARAGVTPLPLARGEQYERFAYGANVAWQSGYANAPTGCGLVAGYQNDDDYLLAYLAQNGDYGVSPLTAEGFAPGIFGTQLPPAATPHHLLLVAAESGLHYYLDGQYTGALTDAAAAGNIGIAAVNYESVSMSCQFSNLWVVEF